MIVVLGRTAGRRAMHMLSCDDKNLTDRQKSTPNCQRKQAKPPFHVMACHGPDPARGVIGGSRREHVAQRAQRCAGFCRCPFERP